MDKGLDEALNILEQWAKSVFDVVLDTLLLPFRLVAGLLS